MSSMETIWRKTAMRGCRPGCINMHLPVESRTNRVGELETRHIWTKGQIWNVDVGNESARTVK